MKKLIFAALLAIAGLTHANTPTWTSSPTNTPTFTPTPTVTESPIAIRNKRNTRVYHNASAVKLSDSVTGPATTPTPGGVWLASTNNHAYFVMGTGTAGSEPNVHLQFHVPQNFTKVNGNGMCGQPTPTGSATATPGAGTPTVTPCGGAAGNGPVLQAWFENAWNSTATNTAQICVNVYDLGQNESFPGYPGMSTYLGVTTNIQTLPNSYALSQVTTTSNLVKLVMPAGITQVAANDDIELEFVRSGTSGNLSVGGVTIEYKPLNNLNP